MVKSPILYLSGERGQLSTKLRKTMNDETVSEGIMLIKRFTWCRKTDVRSAETFTGQRTHRIAVSYFSI